ncbi:alpha/beta hydrolase [Peristeroidobacter soli]|uniref:alpha/beta hydrolase n=1 Tax=Peristeroidobacter soli TaxID=2497877 RepID=UPI0015888D6D|nr:alpha/beta hydrolase-fold protein [Peristeroidobacter soli]
MKIFAPQSLAIVAMLIGAAAAAAGNSAEVPEIAAIRSATPETRAAAVATLWSAVAKRGTPLLQLLPEQPGRMRATFVWQQPETENEPNVALIASFAPGGSRQVVPFERLAGTNVMQTSLLVDARARYRYYLAWPRGRNDDPQAIWRMQANGLTYELFTDPHSRHSYVDDFEGAPTPTSYFEGPAAPAEAWLQPDPSIAPGSIDTFEIASTLLNNSRRVSVYTPAGYARSTTRLPLLVLFDREGYLLSVPTPTILDNLIADGTVPPLVAVLVSAIDGTHRSKELSANARFAAFVVDELLPRVRKDYRVTRDPRLTVVAGSSLGGLSSAYLGYLHPETFGNVLSLSGSYWWHPSVDGDDEHSTDQGSGWLPRQYAARPRLPLRFYLAVGSAEGAPMLTPNRLFRDVLTAKGNPLRYDEFQGDHSYLNWRDGLVAGLRFLLTQRTP